jgi:hypothetical protein
MIVITDTNIFFSALLSPKGPIAEILNERRKVQFLVPDYLLAEIDEHLKRLSVYLNKTPKEVKKEFNILLEGMKILSMEDISLENNRKAATIAAEIDKDDTPFIAFHLQFKHKIWTGDKELIRGLENKGYNICITTEELRHYTYKKSET